VQATAGCHQVQGLTYMYSETCEIKTPKSVPNSEVSSPRSNGVSLFHKVAIHRFHCTD
jgi:hypothetical protein